MNLTERIEAKIKEIKFLKGAPLRDLRIVFALILFTTFAAIFSWVLLDAVLAERMGATAANPTAQAVSRLGGEKFTSNVAEFIVLVGEAFVAGLAILARTVGLV